MYKVNPDRNIPWNDLPELPINRDLYYSVEILEQLVEAKSALAKLQGRSVAIPNQGILIIFTLGGDGTVLLLILNFAF